jgi:hypothetical protein
MTFEHSLFFLFFLTHHEDVMYVQVFGQFCCCMPRSLLFSHIMNAMGLILMSRRE